MYIKSVGEFIQRLLPKKNSILCIDYVFFRGSSLIISGWVVNKIKDAKLDVDIFTSSKRLDSKIYRFERDDVVDHYSLNSSAACFGFLLFVKDCSSNLSNLNIIWNDRKYLLSKLRYEVADNIATIKNQIPECPENIETLFLSTLNQATDSAAEVPVQASRVKDKDIQKISNILNRIDSNQVNFLDALEKSVLPSIQKIWKKRQAGYGIAHDFQFGEVKSNPQVSVVVPLYGRFDFMQHQIAQFSNDKSMSHVELIYVLDDPRLAHQVRVSANGLHETFRYPFKLIISEDNRGFSGANNLGSYYSTAPLIMFLNSDVIPKSEGWLTKLVEQFDTLKTPAILGATLLYEDDTIQHMGMCFQQDTNHPGIRMNHHPFKGFHVDLIKHSDLFPVQTVTGACLLMSRELFKRVDGFDEMHILGDFEDSDLCLKVINAGGGVFCSGSVQLYHLERLSQNLVTKGDWKWKLSMANGVYQEKKWNLLIDKVAQ